MLLIQRYPLRFVGALVIGILGLTLDLSCAADEHIADPTAVGPRIAAAPAARVPGATAPSAAAAAGRSPASGVDAPPRDPDVLRDELGRLPGTGHSGVRRLLERYRLSAEPTRSGARLIVGQLREALVGASPGERLGAARVLTQLGPAAGAAELITLSEDPEEEIRLTALRGLGRMQGDDVDPAAERLRAVSCDLEASRDERFQALQSLSRIRVRIDLERIAGVASEESDPLLRLVAARTLLSHRDERAVPVLVRLLDVPRGESCTAVEQAFVQREANQALLAVTPASPPEETATGWTQVIPSIIGVLDTDGFRYVPRTLYPPR